MNFFFRYILTIILTLATVGTTLAQTSWPTPEVENLYKQAREYHSQGNLREAILRYQQAIQIAPEIVLLHRELAQAYYLAQGYDDAIATLEPIIKQNMADAETYKIMAQCLVAKRENKKAKKLLRDAITAMPDAGTLYHQMGLVYEQDNEMVYALESWLEGIEKAPAYHLNYYEAARTYVNTDKPVWVILYGEIFVNIEHHTKRAYDTRAMILNAYKTLFTSLATGNIPKFGTGGTDAGSFEQAVYDTYIKLSPVMSDGYTTENLAMLRTRFIMDWTLQYAQKYPFSLFARHDYMIRNGYFDAYNQWLFGKVENQQQFEAWNRFHQDAIPRLEGWMSHYPYHAGDNEFYNAKTVDGIFQKKKG
jgi:tetratricopeptide (TPR) repeat protein